MPLIELEGASYAYPGSQSPAIDRISLSIDEGEYVAVVGANGSGKSSLLRLLDGLRSPVSGTVRIASLPTSSEEGRRAALRSVGLVFQFPADQIVSSSVEEDVAFGPECLALPREEIRSRVDRSLAAVGLEGVKRRPTHSLSAGQQQRLAVAGALATDARCVAFDEATAMLDPAARETVLGLMDELVASGRAVVHVTQDMSEAARARRVILLDAGRVAFDGSPDELFSSSSAALAIVGLPDCAALARMLGMETRARESAASLASRIIAKLSDPRRGGVERGAPGAASGNGAAESAFELEGVSHAYLGGTSSEVASLEDVDLALPKGALVALVGRTGSGKSTVLQLLDGLASPRAGKVRALGFELDGKAVDLRALRMRAPLSVQRPESALFELYAADDVAFGPRNLGLSGKELVARVRSSMEEVDLGYEAFRDRKTRSLSGGEKRRLALAGVLAMGSEALLLDEPTSALDPATRRRIALLARDKARAGVTVVMATHSMDEAAAADLVAVFVEGRIAALGDPETIFYDRYEGSWGIGRPFAVEVALELERSGFSLGSRPLDLTALARAVLGRDPDGEIAADRGRRP
jgi:energy-coupling factor transporter ATP-binding protein EcfA2